MRVRILTLAMLLATGCDHEQHEQEQPRCLEGGCYYASGYCLMYYQWATDWGYAKSPPNRCPVGGYSWWLDACPNENVIATCIWPNTCSVGGGMVVNRYYYAAFQYDLAPEKAVWCGYGGGTWTTY